LPTPLADVTVTRKGADRIASGHLWIFDTDVAASGGASPGAAVRVLDSKSRPIGVAHYSATSKIRLRLLSNVCEPLDSEFYSRRLRAAYNHRRAIVHDSDCYRLVHGEGDLLPGLIVDRYGDLLVIQILSQGMAAAQETILDCLTDLLHPTGILARNDAAVRERENLPREITVLRGGVPEEMTARMNGLTLAIDPRRGQKTGLFLDQRENYLAAARYASGRVLDCFTSTGGFAVHLAAGCEAVEAIDSSASALAIARRNAALNSITSIEFREADVFELLAGYSSARRKFQTVVLDPPAFAKSRKNLEAAARGYKEINLRALRLLEPGGILVTCSCSQAVSEAALLEIVAEASLDSGRRLRILERRTQAQDHPILLTVPETHYLKCVILQVI
jgi:23S rRNA (cytosine1962-C5)-methyltransferase